QLWRRAGASTYTPRFEVRAVRYRPDGEPNVSVTSDDRKVAVATLIRAAGLAKHKANLLEQYVVYERASAKGLGPEVMFADAHELLNGIERMQEERRRSKRKLKIDPEWDEMAAWLRAAYSGAEPGDADGHGERGEHAVAPA
ncbi:MAG: hypothetical protein JWO74_1212, partial [Solirubrobacterales bacterium]|nr:hypothetical protein [Solirubrobacterales bacterium]